MCVCVCVCVCVFVLERGSLAPISQALICCLGRSIERWSGVRVIADLVGQSMTERESKREMHRESEHRGKKHTSLRYTCPDTHSLLGKLYTCNDAHTPLSLYRFLSVRPHSHISGQIHICPGQCMLHLSLSTSINSC